MSIATEISRLQTAKADIKTAIEAKGVTVPSNATLDTYDTYVSQISGGGGTNYLEQCANKSLSGAISSTQLGTNIGANMPGYFLYDQDNITSVNLTGTGATKIATNFCNECGSLSTVTIPNTVTEIGNDFCSNARLISQPTIPSSVTKIGNYFLRGNTVIYAGNIPSTVTSVGNDCFNGCSSLIQVIYNAPTTDLSQAFCTSTNSLALVDLNSSVSNIKSYCMSRGSASTNLLEVVLRKTDAIVTVANNIGDTGYNAAFRNRRNIKVYVPSSLKASYEADTKWAAGVTAGYLTFVNLEGSQYE